MVNHLWLVRVGDLTATRWHVTATRWHVTATRWHTTVSTTLQRQSLWTRHCNTSLQHIDTSQRLDTPQSLRHGAATCVAVCVNTSLQHVTATHWHVTETWHTTVSTTWCCNMCCSVDSQHIDKAQRLGMGWLRLVGSLKLQVSCAEYHLFYRDLLQKRPIIWRSLQIVATPNV